MGRKIFLIIAVVTVFVLLMAVISGCKSTTTTTTTTTTENLIRGAVVNSDSISSASIISITKQTTGYPWKVDILIQSTIDVNGLPNPVSGSVGKVVTVFTDQDMSTYKVDEKITAQIKYAGDVNIPAGISLYMYTVQPAVTPAY